MPFSLSLSRHISFFVVSLLTTLAGSQAVYMYYKPLDELEELIQQEHERRKTSSEIKYT